MNSNSNNTRITLASNAKRTIKTVIIFKASSAESDRKQLFDIAKNKLRVKKPQRLFLSDGRELLGDDFISLLHTDCTVLVSCGEEFVGIVRESQVMETKPANVFLMADKSFVDTEALKQLDRTATLPGMLSVCGYPDLCPGLRFPVGASFLVKERVFPELIGGDIGCGMTLYALPTLAPSTNISRLASKLHSLDAPWTEGDSLAWLAHKNPFGNTESESNRTHTLQTLGTIGAGNHFAELQTIHALQNNQLFSESFPSLKHAQNIVFLLVHSGSRSLGKSILDTALSKTIDDAKTEGFTGGLSFVEETPEFKEYMDQHDQACHWARRNRELIARRFLGMIFGGDNPSASIEEQEAWMETVATKLIDIHHNNVTKHCCENVEGLDESVWVHRKGAAPSTEGIVPIPGSRGDYTYLVKPKGDQQKNAYSLPHGAGRKWSRAKANSLVTNKYKNEGLESLTKTAEFGSTVICDDKNLLAEEAPEAYKNIQDVVNDIADFVDCVAVMKPILTYKCRNYNKEK
ncbi:UNVERIFIED_CONTAM: hypothetical protein HDU68_002663 [Siphonaria sp. JEL0065]|nr:hypothetical protein HDU68_002663 [Siphonaria sp. JEL0065]